MLRPCAVAFCDARGVQYFCYRLLFQNTDMKLLNNKADAFYSDLCFIDIVDSIVGVCQAKFQGAQNLEFDM